MLNGEGRRLIKIRITPVLKALGFIYDHKFNLYKKDLLYWARVYKTSDRVRSLEIWKDLYNGRGEFAGSTLIIKNFPLDVDDELIEVCWTLFAQLSVGFNAPHLLERFAYFIGKEEHEFQKLRLEYEQPNMLWRKEPSDGEHKYILLNSLHALGDLKRIC